MFLHTQIIFRIIILCSVNIILSNGVISQGENSVWHFGNNVGIQFVYPANGDPYPEVITHSRTRASKEVATYSTIVDGKGKFITSTDGVYIYNSRGERIERDMFERTFDNNADRSGTALIVRQPSFPGRIIIYSDHMYNYTGESKLLYIAFFIVDGEIVFFYDRYEFPGFFSGAEAPRRLKPAESIALAKGTCNNLWMVWRRAYNPARNDNEPTSIISQEVIEIIDPDLSYFGSGFSMPDPSIKSDIGTAYTSTAHNEGKIRMSSNHERIGSTSLPGLIELYDFNRTTGKATNTLTLATEADNPYGICFSPNDELVYVTESVSVGVDLWETSIFQYDLLAGDAEAIRNSKTKIAEFEGPTELVDMQITEHNQIFIGREGESFLSAITQPDERGLGCAFTEIGIDLSPHTFAGPGLQNLVVVPDDVDPPIDPFILPQDTIICAGNSIELIPKDGNIVCRWNDGSDVPSMQIDAPGTYWVEVNQNNKCVVRDTITITYQDNPVPDLGIDTTICEGATVTLDPQVTGVDLSWQDATSDPTFTTSEEGTYWVEASVNNCVARDSIIISYLPSILDLGMDTVLCDESSLTLSVDIPNATTEWQDGTTDQTYEVTMPGDYSVYVTIDACEYRDTIAITNAPLPTIDLGIDSVVCEERPITLSAPVVDSYLWQDGSTGPSYIIDMPGEYWLELSKDGCTARDTINFSPETELCNCAAYIPNTFSPEITDKNGTFSPFFSCDISSYELRIFDRWGNDIFVTQDPTQDWNGKFNATEMPEGVYSFLLSYQFSSNPTVIKESGTITLLR